MLKFVILLSVVACALGAAVPEGMLPQLDGRIVGGAATTISSFPWQISLHRSGSHSCGGSIYNSKIIVTAAHCLQSVSASVLKVRAGSTYWNSGGVLVNVAAFKTHEGYNSRTMVNDIAVIRLSSSLTMSSTIKPIELATIAPPTGAAASVSGWGTTSSGAYGIPSELRYVDVEILSTSACASSTYGYGSEIKPSMICAYTVGKDACQGDSGGPLVSGGRLVGVVSWGYGCAFTNYPGVYADVAVLHSWVENTAATFSMLKFVILLSAIACALGAAVPEGMLPQLDGRIVGGEATSISYVPWQISLQRSGSHSCGGSIYNSKIIVTAAHCLQSVSASVLKIRAGSSYWNSGGVVVSVAAFKNHEGYNPRTMVNDIAVIRLSSSLTMSSTIRPIDLATSAPPTGAAASVSGWGTTSSGGYGIPTQLRYVDVEILSTSSCASSTYGYGSEIQPSMICAYTVGKDACQGDSGGPLVSAGRLVGVVSWGYGCAFANYPGVYADVAVLRTWVVNTASTLISMLKFVILLSAIACALGAAVPEGMLPQLDGRIVGGEATTISSFPWQISLQRSGSHSCGGSIYSSNIIVTAAHCLQSVSASVLKIRAGSTYWNSGGVLVSVAAFKTHEGYNSRTMVNDIAVIRLSSSLTMSSTIKAIELATTTPPNGAAASVSGWGTTSSGAYGIPTQLRCIDVEILSNSICASPTYGYGAEIKPSMICAYTFGRDACQGDSGGPLVSGGRLVGVVSWGYGCAAANYPGVYADVAVLHSWVETTASTL
ncbi:transmembrane protease serine 9-like [Calliphora vicina]|uniref:transmembrane protease serine 9-like n=1 Tax=Calliphora vicina TaxID=7373 RepID=UPI00325C0266